MKQSYLEVGWSTDFGLHGVEFTLFNDMKKLKNNRKLLTLSHKIVLNYRPTCIQPEQFQVDSDVSVHCRPTEHSIQNSRYNSIDYRPMRAYNLGNVPTRMHNESTTTLPKRSHGHHCQLEVDDDKQLSAKLLLQWKCKIRYQKLA